MARFTESKDGVHRTDIRITIRIDRDLHKKLKVLEKQGVDWRSYAKQGAQHEIEALLIMHANDYI